MTLTANSLVHSSKIEVKLESVENDSKKNSSFTIDQDQTGVSEMPSVTRLLNRKSLKLGDAKKSEAPPSKSEEKSDTEATQAFVKPQGPQVQARHRTPMVMNDLTIWEPARLASTQDPISQTLHSMFKTGIVHAAVFLAYSNSQFVATAASAPDAAKLQVSLWNGLQFNPQNFDQVWEALKKNQWVDLGPPGTKTMVTSARNVLRAAFGVKSSDTLALFLVGSDPSPRGILAILCSQSPHSYAPSFLASLK
jgi:hypothetical protein